MFVEAANITNNAELASQSTVLLRSTAGSIVNTGRVAGDAGLEVSSETSISNQSQLLSKASVVSNAKTGFENTAAGQVIGDAGVTISANTISNAGQIAAQGGELVINSDDTFSNTGTLISAGNADFNVDSAITNSGQILVEDVLTLKGKSGQSSGSFTNSASALINAGSANLTVASFNNAGALQTHDGTLQTEVAGQFINSGRIEAKTNAAINLDGTLNNSGSIITEQALTVGGLTGRSTGQISNSSAGIINGGAILTVKASSISNAGGIGSSAGNLVAEITGNIENDGLLYSAANATFKLDGNFINDEADVLAESNLIIEGLGSARAAAISNLSGNIEAITANVTLKADTIENRRTQLVVGTTSSSTVSNSGNTRTTVTTIRETLANSTAASRLLAGGNINIDTSNLANSYSQIAANGDLLIAATTVTNTGRDLIETINTNAVTTRYERYCSRRIFGACISRKTRTIVTSSSNTASSTYDTVFGTIEAGGALDANVSGFVSNNSVRQGASQIGLSSGGRNVGAATVSSASDVSRLSDLNSLNVSINSITGRSALFDATQSPDAPFLFETRSEFVDPSIYFGSDYFLSQIGEFNQENVARRFGDAYIETRLLLEQVFAQTGRRNLDGFFDDRSLVQSLFDNAVDAQQTLNLTVGVALAPSQVAQLTNNIAWLENRVVNGETVLVPRLYLAPSTQNEVNIAGAQIRAGEAIIQTASLNNSGSITGLTGLNLIATEAIVNQGGSLFSSADITVESGELFSNQSGTVSGENVTITAENILNDTVKIRDQRANGFTDRAQQTARLEAQGNLLLQASGTIASVGGEFDSGETTTLNAGQSVEIAALQIERLADDQFKGGYNRESSLTNQLASITAGDQINIISGGDATLRGVDTKSGGDTTIDAKGNVLIAAVQDRESKDFKLDIKSGGFLGTETNIREQSSSTATRGSTVSSDETIKVVSQEENIGVVASRLEAEKQILLDAKEGEVALLTTTDSEFEQKERREEDLFWWNETDKGSLKETINHVEIEAGGGLTINAGEGIRIEYKKTGNLNASLNQLSDAPGLEWIGELRNDPRVDWNAVEARFEEWDYETQGLTEAGAAFVSLVVAAVSGGALSGLSATLASGLGFAVDGAVQAALQAGLNTLAKQATIALINNQGDLGEALKTLGSSDSLRALATSMVAAGLTSHISDVAGIGKDLAKTAPLADRVVQDIQRGLIRATVNAGVSTAIQGGKLDDALVSALRQEAAAVIGENIAQEIGTAAKAGKLNTATQIIAHAALGCITGAVSSGDCGSGAIGGAVGETVGLTLLSDKQAEEVGNELGERLQNGELSPEQAEALAYKWEQQGVNLSKLAAGLSAALVGGDVNVAANTAENAVENNALCAGACIAGAIVVIGALWTAYDVATVYQEEGGEAALKQLALDGVITIVSGGAGKVAYKVGGKVIKSGPEAWKAVKNSGLVKQLGNSRSVSFDPKQIQKKYTKHSADFGVIGNYNKTNASKFQSAVDAHVKSSNVKPITGTYRGDPVTHYVDPKSGLNAMKDSSGNFISGWKLNPSQLKNVLERGTL